ncbi:Hypothetical protein HDN1F_12230 [gamma proteobacterium HdN1]|nr:Hypothetical protein HDN1F_12230 [gamma proteobacterium HdN1]
MRRGKKSTKTSASPLSCKLLVVAVIVASAGCSTIGGAKSGPSFLERVPYVRDIPYLKKSPPPLHTFALPKDEKYFDPSYLGSVEKGEAAYKQGNYITALHEFYGLANTGDPSAQYALGLMFAYGQGVPRDAMQARYWLERAATRGNADAQYQFASLLWQGTWLKRDSQNALYWYKAAAKQDHADAAFFLAQLYLKGSNEKGLRHPIKMDQPRARDWMELAARNGHVAAMHNLALIYQFGAGVPVNLAQAQYWFSQAARKDESEIAYDYARFHQIQASPWYDPERALYWLEIAALNGNQDANRELLAQRKLVETGRNSLALFGAPLATQKRSALRRILHQQGGIPLSEPDQQWFDSYDARGIWAMADRLLVGYVLASEKVAALQYRLPSADSPALLAKVRQRLQARHGEPNRDGTQVLIDGIYNEWQLEDTRIVLSKGPEHSLFVSYYVEPAWSAMLSEQLRQRNEAPVGKALVEVY